MQRREFVAGAAMTAALAALPSPQAMAQERKVRLQLAGAYASTVAIVGPGQKFTADMITKLSGGSIDCRFFEPGALVPASQYVDAVAAGSLDAAWSSLGFFTGKNIAFAMYSSVPFGPEFGEYQAWMKHGGGEKLMKALAGKFGIEVMNCGILAPESSGWFRKEIKTLDDLKGLKMRFFGLGASVMQKLGVATQTLQAGEIFQALQLGTIDATEFSMPALDLTLGLHQVAKHYYFPGWHQAASFNHMFISRPKWAELSDNQKLVVQAACDMTILHMYGEAEALQGKAIREIQSKGVTIHKWGPEFLQAFRKTWLEVVEEQKAKSPDFAEGWASLSAFREEYKAWKELGYL
jgi:TRAP-type mannitol/chloroaromatic compound transport system substrate-binding protein